jgi:large subunit ribosomal protein L10
MFRDTKEQFVEQMRADLERAQGVLFVDYTGLTVEEANSFRRKLGEQSIGYQVVKNTLMTRAMEGTPYADASKLLKGSPTGVILGFEDPVEPAKATVDFIKECKHLRIKGGIVDQQTLPAESAEALSKMPSRAEAQAAVVALALSPAGRLISQIKNPAGRIVGAVEALAEKAAE